MKVDVAVVGSGLAGLSAALTAAESGLSAVVLERGTRFGGATANSGGQVWVGGNHVAARLGIDDDIDDAVRYVEHLARREPALHDPAATREWLHGAREAARWFEDRGAIGWDVIPDYPDYYFPDAPGSRPTGRYLTAAPFALDRLGPAAERLIEAPHFPVGITYGEMFAWGGMSSRTTWDLALLDERRRAGVLTFGRAIAASFAAAVVDRHVDICTEHHVIELLADGDRVVGVRCFTPTGEVDIEARAVVLATGAHDWSPDLSSRFTRIPSDDGGSVAPPTVAGDAFSLAAPLGVATVAFPPWAAPIIPGYRVATPEWPGDTGYRTCFEHCLPHTFVVNAAGDRFCDDSFHPALVRAAAEERPDGTRVNLPMFMVWDESHHQKYGLGRTAPGAPYPDGLVVQADTLTGLAATLGIDPDGLARTAQRFNADAAVGADPAFGRGANLSVRRFRGDANAIGNPNVGPVETPPFFGMRLRLLNTGIAAAGLSTGANGIALRADGTPVEGLYAAGECSARVHAGVGYNSGYSLSRAMTYGYLAVRDVAGR